MSKITSIKKVKQTEYMGPLMLREFHEILTKMREEAVRTLNTKAKEEIESQRMPDEIDIASMQEAAMLEMRRRERDNLLLKKIDKSLAMIASDEYGYCPDCGGTIGADRLRARPTADLCISCKEIAEKTEHQFSKRRAA